MVNEDSKNEVIGLIRELFTDTELNESVQLIRAAFQTVADQLSLTPENAPTNPAFITLDKLKEAKEKGVQMFGLFQSDHQQAGFIALEKAGDGLYYIERLAVRPAFRHRGYGKRLLDFAFQYVKDAGGIGVSIAIIDENTVLKRWYQAYGFIETGCKTFEHLPFTVCFMRKEA